MTQFTSFVAVEEMIVTDGGQPRRIDVPLENPEGVRMENAGESRAFKSMQISNLSSFYIGGSPPVNGRGGAVGGAAGPSGTLPPPKGAKAPPVNMPPMIASVTVSPSETLGPPDAVKAAEANRRAEVNRKLNRSVLTVVERLRKKEALTSADEAGFIRNGKAEVQVWLTEKSEANLAKLKELGFEVVLDPKSPRLIIGRISIDKLEALAELTFVSYVSPQVSK
jgi:hypothetical protein